MGIKLGRREAPRCASEDGAAADRPNGITRSAVQYRLKSVQIFEGLAAYKIFQIIRTSGKTNPFCSILFYILLLGLKVNTCSVKKYADLH